MLFIVEIIVLITFPFMETTHEQLNSSVLTPKKQSKIQCWIRKENEVLKEDFDNLWVVSRLFAFDEWKDIVSFLEEFIKSKLTSTLYLLTRFWLKFHKVI